MFCVGLAVFTVGSAAAALCTTAGTLVAARAIQGAGAAIVTPLSLTLLVEAFPAQRRGSAIGAWGGIVGTAVGIGPVIGGAVVGGLDWHWMFWVNVPVGAAVIALSWRRLAESTGPRSRLDPMGLVLAAVGLLGVTFGLVRANAAGWTSSETLVAIAAGASVLVAFVACERRSTHPMLPVALFAHRGFVTANAVSLFMYAGLFGTLFFMAQLLQSGLGYSPLRAGLGLLAWTTPPMVIAPVAGKLADRYGNRPFMAAGLALQGAGLAWVAAVASPHLGYSDLVAPFVVAGVGTSLCFPTVANAVMGSVPMTEAGVASGTNSAFRELGGVVGVALLAAIFARRGGYASPASFVAGFAPAIWVGVGLSAAGVVAALLSPGRAGVAMSTLAEPGHHAVALPAGGLLATEAAS
jgi:EmrB/QacA subfamily drug resistance transporter